MAERRGSGQSGFSLIEALLVLVIASAVILVLAVGMQTVVETDGQTNRIQRGGLALTTVTEALRSSDVPFVQCPVGATTIERTYEDAVKQRLQDVDKVVVPTFTFPEDSGKVITPSFAIVQVDYWTPPTFSAASTSGGVWVTTSTTTTTALAPGGPGTAGQCVPDTPGGDPPTLLRFRVAVTTGKETLYGEVVKRKPLDGEARADSGGT